jgi:hypothetical protein
MAKFIALAPEHDGQPRMPWTIGGRLIIDTEQAWVDSKMPHDGDLVRVPADTLGFEVSMMDSPAGKRSQWWLIEDAADGSQQA